MKTHQQLDQLIDRIIGGNVSGAALIRELRELLQAFGDQYYQEKINHAIEWAGVYGFGEAAKARSPLITDLSSASGRANAWNSNISVARPTSIHSGPLANARMLWPSTPAANLSPRPTCSAPAGWGRVVAAQSRSPLAATVDRARENGRTAVGARETRAREHRRILARRNIEFGNHNYIADVTDRVG